MTWRRKGLNCWSLCAGSGRRCLRRGLGLGPKLSDEQREDVAFGLRIAKEISRLEIGQSVVVKEGDGAGGGGV